MTKRRQLFNLSMFLGLIAAGVFGSLFLTEYVLQNPASQDLIRDFGISGLFILSFVSGLNLLLPVPAATFAPIFSAGGMSLPTIIFVLVLGTMSANLLSYVAGRYGGKFTRSRYPELQQKMLSLYKNHQYWLPHFVFGFAALIPLPDEVYLVPLGILGIKLQQFIIPLTLGTIFYQTFATYGIDNIFKLIL